MQPGALHIPLSLSIPHHVVHVEGVDQVWRRLLEAGNAAEPHRDLEFVLENCNIISDLEAFG